MTLPADAHVAALPLEKLSGGNELLQSGFWGEFKQPFGWKPFAFQWTFHGQKGQVLVLVRSFARVFSLAYVPYGPVIPPAFEAELRDHWLAWLGGELRALLPSSCFMIRFDMTGGNSGKLSDDFSPDFPAPLTFPFYKAPYRVQPQDTVILPLHQNLDELLAGMGKKTRYNIKLSARKEVKIRVYQGEEAISRLPLWYHLYEETGKRDGIALHPESYYRRLFSLSEDQPQTSPQFLLYLASHEGDVLAGIIVSRFGNRATYMYGASGNKKRKLMPNHLLQWTAITDAAKEGSEFYDFFGVPPTGDAHHPMHGLWRFKTGFGGWLHHYLGAWDFPYSPFLYRLYQCFEKWRERQALRRKQKRSR
ncbi:MAG: peptidoglycan bridge formation glycyltransferase FemA/FemB family protein [Spirochaetales bacterium]|nr:peptidoglycan bridge formation glycyltransferase FemA/FemB family protein [Spirochaetales bacterium]